MLIGLDLDNTIISYDRLLHRIAVKQGLVANDTPPIKRIIRDEVRREHGDLQWQRLQVAIYGTEIYRAEIMDGALDFLLALKRNGHSIKIISHKTRYPNNGEMKVDLRAAAMGFLEQQGFFSKSGPAMIHEDVSFLSTRREKVDTIRTLSPDVFIDDLKEVFMEPHFPQRTMRILFSNENDHGLPGVKSMATFHEISDYFFSGVENGTFSS